MKQIVASALKKITLELVYQVVEERSKEILGVVKELHKRQEDDFRYLDQKIDYQLGQLRQEIGQVRQEIGQVRQEISQLHQRMESQISQLNQKIDSQISQLNQRIDTVIQLLVEIKR